MRVLNDVIVKMNGHTGEEKDYLIPGIFMEKIASEKV